MLVLTDDQRYDTLACNGGEVVETPNLDRLAAGGARFTRAYVPTSLCCPARASLYTGLYAHVHGIRNNEDQADFLYPLMERAIEKCSRVVDRHAMTPPRSVQKDFKRPQLNRWIDDN